MQFVAEGPNIPEKFLYAHERGDVVFFCGAGISKGVGLPDFKELVTGVYADFNRTLEKRRAVDCSWSESVAYKRGDYDVVFHLLEQVQSRNAVRECVRKRLSVKTRQSDIHRALLQLAMAKSSEGVARQLHLVTTNYDVNFRAINPRLKEYSAPLLPIAKKQKWDGLVYLHGRLSDNIRTEDLNSLVLTSGDFGIAYLLEKWAARFISELLDNFIVCFVGYSANDVIIRYVLDALSADKAMGVRHMPCYAFAGCDASHREQETKRWEDKGVVPIMYDSKNGHRLLVETLVKWADIYNSGINGKTQIASACADTLPQKDPVIGQGLLWALADPSGSPARAFANHNPKPDFLWLNVLGKENLCGQDLKWLGVDASTKEIEDFPKFSFVNRPAQLSCAGRMALVDMDSRLHAQYDSGMECLSKWAASFVNDKRLLLWVYQNGDVLHPTFKKDIESALSNPENGVSKQMYQAWRLYLDGYMIRPKGSWWQPISPTIWDMGAWLERVHKHGLDVSQLNEFLAKTRPLLGFRRWLDFSNGNASSAVGNYHFEYVYMMAHEIPHFNKLNEVQQETFIANYGEIVYKIIDRIHEVEMLLDKIVTKGGRIWCRSLANDSEYVSGGWEPLIFLLKDALVKMADCMPARTVAIVDKLWHSKSYVSKRLALIGASFCRAVDVRKFWDMMFKSDVRKFWHPNLDSEMEMFLQCRAHECDEKLRLEIEDAILMGKQNYRCDESVIEYRMTRRAKIISSSGCGLMRMELRRLYEDSCRCINDFNSRRVASRDCRADVLSSVESVEGVRDWLKGQHDGSMFSPDVRREWSDFVRSNFVVAFNGAIAFFRERPYNHNLIYAALALEVVARDCTESKVDCQLLGECRNLLVRDLDFLVEKLPNLLAFVLAKMVEQFDDSKTLELCIGYFERLNHYAPQIHSSFKLERDRNYGDVTSGSVFLGFQCQSLLVSRLLDLWGKKLNEDENAKDCPKGKIPDLIRSIFEVVLAMENINDFKASSEMLFMNLLTIYKLDIGWTREKVVPFLLGRNDRERWLFAWNRFLSSPFMTPDMLLDLHDAVICFVSDTEALKSIKEQGGAASRLIQNIVLPIATGYGEDDVKMLLSQLGKIGDLTTLSSQLRFQMEQSEDKSRFWSSLLRPLFSNLWPKDVVLNSEEVLNDIVAIISMAGASFVDAFKKCKIYLSGKNKPSIVSGLTDYWNQIQDIKMLANFFASIVPNDRRHGWPIAEFIGQTALLNGMDDMRDLKDEIERACKT